MKNPRSARPSLFPLAWATGMVLAMVPGRPIHAAQTAPPEKPAGQVVVSGAVPDEATRQHVLERLRVVYGVVRVVDRIVVEDVVAPPRWGEHVGRVVSPALLKVSRGQLSVRGQDLEVSGEVAGEADRDEVTRSVASALNPTYAVKTALRVSAVEQGLIDQLLSQRVVEFEPGSSVLRPAGAALLDDVAAAIARMPGKRIEIVGHTDALGSRDANVALSLARADAVRAYLVTRKGLPSGVFGIAGLGPDRPIAGNETAEGRARNRRIEFRVGR